MISNPRTIQSFYSEKEQSVDKTLVGLAPIIGVDYGLIKEIERVRQYYDEPKFWYYSAELNNAFIPNDGKHFHTKASGASLFSEKEALLKCLGESIERYCNFIFLKESASVTKKIKDVKGKLVDPRSISAFSQNQLIKSKFKHFKIDNNSTFRWSECISLTDLDRFLVPSQFLYLSYPYLKGESSIYSSISTGVAGGACLSAAIVRGICEIIERDAFMIFYLNKLKAPKIDLQNTKDEKVKKLTEIANRYKLEVVSLDLTTDIGIPTIASIVINRTGFGKAVSVGLKCDFDIKKAILGSVEEAFHTRSWLRSSYENKKVEVKIQDLYKNSDIRSRGFLWYHPEVIKNLNFWIAGANAKNFVRSNENLKSGEKLKKLIEIFNKKNYGIYYKDITLKQFKDLNYLVVKVVIPKIIPLYLNENFPLLGGDRLYTIPKELGYENHSEEELNMFPHPFL